MAIHNGEAFLDEAIRSILSQTYRDFEFLVIDDASHDETWRLLHAYKDPRLRLAQNERNIGLAATLNRGLDMIDSEFVARMDADDISVPRRLEWQIDFMRNREEVGVSGMWVKAFGDHAKSGLIRFPSGTSCIAASLLFTNPICHPTAIMRRHWLEKFHLAYDPVFSRSEDYDLWIRASRHFALDNMQRVGLHWRMHRESVTSSFSGPMVKQASQLSLRLLEGIGLNPNPSQLDFHARVSAGQRQYSEDDLKRAESWLCQVRNSADNTYESNGLNMAISMVWFRLCTNSTPATWRIMQRYRNSVLSRGYRPAPQQWAVFLASTLWHHIFRKVARA